MFRSHLKLTFFKDTEDVACLVASSTLSVLVWFSIDDESVSFCCGSSELLSLNSARGCVHARNGKANDMCENVVMPKWCKWRLAVWIFTCFGGLSNWSKRSCSGSSVSSDGVCAFSSCCIWSVESSADDGDDDDGVSEFDEGDVDIDNCLLPGPFFSFRFLSAAINSKEKKIMRFSYRQTNNAILVAIKWQANAYCMFRYQLCSWALHLKNHPLRWTKSLPPLQAAVDHVGTGCF